MAPCRLRVLDPADQRPIQLWLEDYLRQHLGWWSSPVCGEPWPRARIDEHLRSHDLVGAEWRNLSRASGSQDSFVRVAHDGERGTGVVWGEVRNDRYLRTPMGVISWIYVDQDRRRQGIARLLLEATDAWMSWRGVEGRSLHVTSANEAACALYRGRGYETVDHRMLARRPEPDGERDE